MSARRPVVSPLTLLAPALLASGLAAGCSKDDAAAPGGAAGPAPGTTTIEATLEMEVRDRAALTILRHDPTFDFTLDLGGNGYGYLDGSKPLTGAGRVRALPEAGLETFTAELALPAMAGGKCGDAPVSLALSLVRRADAMHLAGALTVYCADHRWSGVPARVLRIAEALKKPGEDAP
jgi:hypothetical protein